MRPPTIPGWAYPFPTRRLSPWRSDADSNRVTASEAGESNSGCGFSGSKLLRWKCYVHSERKAVSHHQSGRVDEHCPDGRAAEKHRRRQVSFRGRPAFRLESLPGSSAEAVQDPRRPTEAEEGEVAS